MTDELTAIITALQLNDYDLALQLANATEDYAVLHWYVTSPTLIPKNGKYLHREFSVLFTFNDVIVVKISPDLAKIVREKLAKGTLWNKYG